MTAIRELREAVKSSEPLVLGPATLWVAPWVARFVPLHAILKSEIIDDADRAAIQVRRTGGPAERAARRRLYRRLAVAAQVGCEPESVRLDVVCSRCGSTSHGPPRVMSHPELRMSASSVDDLAVVALSSRPVGVDVERPERLGDLSVSTARRTIPVWARVESAFVPNEDPLKTWTAVEAITKGMASGLSTTLGELEVQMEQWDVVWSWLDSGATLALAHR